MEEEEGQNQSNDGASTIGSQKSSRTGESQGRSEHGGDAAMGLPQEGQWDVSEMNPFTMPSDEEVFALRETEKKRKEAERERLKDLHVHQKTTWSSRTGQTRRLDEGHYELDEETIGTMNKKFGLDRMVLGNRERRREKENMTEFIDKKREMFLVQMSLDTKRAEIKKLEERAQQREEALKRSEKMLGDDAVRFDAFLKENDAKAVKAIHNAELETKQKQEKVQEIKKLNAHITALRSEMSKYEEQLDDCARYKMFLDKLTPKEYFEEQKSTKTNRKITRRAKRKIERETILKDFDDKLEDEEETRRETCKEKFKKLSHNDREKKMNDLDREIQRERDRKEKELKQQLLRDFPADGEDTSSGEEIPMYFQDPKQLLDIFASLEESNLFLIQNSQETEEALEELKQKHAQTRQRMEAETESLKSEIQSLRSKIRVAEERGKQLIDRSKQKTGTDKEEKLLEQLRQKVTEVYTKSIEPDTNVSTLQMLTVIESRLEEFLRQVGTMNEEYVEQAERAKEKERRARVRDQKMADQKKVQEYRIKKALKRSRAPVHKKTGKPVMFRSTPARKKRQTETDDKQDGEEEDIREFFT